MIELKIQLVHWFPNTGRPMWTVLELGYCFNRGITQAFKGSIRCTCRNVNINSCKVGRTGNLRDNFSISIRWKLIPLNNLILVSLNYARR